MKIETLYNRHRMVTLQLLGWGVILGTSLFWSVGSANDSFDGFALTVFGINIAILLLIYLLNYLIFIPRYLFRDNRKGFFIANLLLLVTLMLFSYFFNEIGLLESLKPQEMSHRPRPNMMYLARDFINYILMVGLVTALRLAERLQKSEEALKEAESARIKAELANLRSQINPHFLLNTLNNIYALTAIDTIKAQKTIKELSHLLRYILYDNMGESVSLTGEVEFLKTYIELMSIRLPRKVRVQSEFNIDPSSTTTIAPLIFISLIENAFKHSVSASGEGYIEIYFEDRRESGEVILSIRNSNNAKQEQDKSGHGIGLEQIRRRLEMLYKGRHIWQVESSEQEYRSEIILKSEP